MRPRDDVSGHQLAHRFGRCRSGIHRRAYAADIALHHGRDAPPVDRTRNFAALDP